MSCTRTGRGPHDRGARRDAAAGGWPVGGKRSRRLGRIADLLGYHSTIVGPL
jgi:hypothetical protein